MRILVIQSDRKTAEHLRVALDQRGYEVQVSHDGDHALVLAEKNDFDVIILGINLPHTNGFHILRKLHQEQGDVPVVFLSRKDDLRTRVRALKCGADDYIINPFEVEELEARLRAVARRSGRQNPTQHIVGDLSIDVAARRVLLHGKEVTLTTLEFKLLEYLARTPDITRTRTEILEHVWGYDFNPGTNVITALVRRLRQKLRRQDGTQPIVTIRGVGYCIESRKIGDPTQLPQLSKISA